MKYTLEDLDHDIGLLLAGELYRFDELFGEGASKRALGIGFDDFHDGNTGEMPSWFAGDSLRALGNYVIDARWGGPHQVIDALHAANEIMVVLDTSPAIKMCAVGTPAVARQVFDSALARWKLDFNEEDLTIRDVALLCGLDERTVRNATGSEVEGRLVTTKVGGSVYISPADAALWLSGKRNFKPTVFGGANGAPKGASVSNYAVIELTQGNIDNSHIYLREAMTLLPEAALGGGNADESGQELEIVWGGDEAAVSDVDSKKMIFRKRGWVKTFFALHGLRGGDKVVVQRIGDKRLHIFPAKT
jgi:hypothetical protein